MSRYLSTLMVILISLISISGIEAQVIGKWKTVDDADGKEKSVVEIYEQNGKLFGKVVQLASTVKSTICNKCDGDLKNKPLVGMVIFKNLTKTENGGKDGEILDPNNGKMYSCYIELVAPDKLKLRGYIGVSALGRTQYWYRAK